VNLASVCCEGPSEEHGAEQRAHRSLFVGARLLAAKLVAWESHNRQVGSGILLQKLGKPLQEPEQGRGDAEDAHVSSPLWGLSACRRSPFSWHADPPTRQHAWRCTEATAWAGRLSRTTWSPGLCLAV
jgi:hypothetical protein